MLVHRLCWIIAGTGALLPWAVGVVLTVAPSTPGAPAWSWSFLLDPARVPVELVLTVWLASPHVLLAVVAWAVLSRPAMAGARRWERLAPVIGGYVWGSAGALTLFVEVFRQFHPMVFLTPLPLWYAGDVLIGIGGGILVAALAIVARSMFLAVDSR